MIALFDSAEEVRTLPAVTELRLRLYIRQRTSEAKTALSQVHAFLESTELSYEFQLLDANDNRELALEDQVPFTPLLIRLSPAPVLWITMPQPNVHELKAEILGWRD